ncbi:hypothetical protein EOA27_12175 [Mesorhizobium sp. M2A.F.Ca.ET.037.01.1.1]|uniref:hypothetical protein n=1 Tax=unclassified Mesorhizobium TaxID=325217 RepID=UPI000F74FC90|nr:MULTISPECIES: hypothetical protein [unclassified Mesorhizobium]RUX19152.1 hypothetical protein EOA27_12175 [Mesorhizobium sp. M2A.F.Ca.ET.037.01.1.1]RUX97117.1 hypothetical protein EOA25_28520 [Mesorhizobium sp. M2A.F.Ca.ET.040.01.1.1]RVC70684.1 hypothetical protein EN759_03155 [Mesorhizobium sp. M00.F.Ca.ET.038.03.1.1]RVC79301.1 hypothetical protein EN766_07635 [Mesorhizobium sp. M2A.F.Ca.ET.046.02.1.1]RWX71677.1 hypothetical protein EOA24_05515 [Mesorhizobium sp. M2A.F.Ca.ET.039.01.1.1]
MSRRSQRDLCAQAIQSLDQEIASLLTAIEREKVPDRQTRLALELQNALIEKRKGDMTAERG